MLSAIIYPHLVLILFIWGFSPFFLVSPATVCQFCLSFKKPAISFTDFSIVILVTVSFISTAVGGRRVCGRSQGLDHLHCIQVCWIRGCCHCRGRGWGGHKSHKLCLGWRDWGHGPCHSCSSVTFSCWCCCSWQVGVMCATSPATTEFSVASGSAKAAGGLE